jgi:hypothetical protein
MHFSRKGEVLDSLSSKNMSMDGSYKGDYDRSIGNSGIGKPGKDKSGKGKPETFEVALSPNIK